MLGRFCVSCVIALAAVLFVGAGCQSSGSTPAAATAQKGVVVSTANGVMVYVPTANGKGAQVLSSSGMKHCAQCEADAASYFQNGVLVPVCSECHAQRIPVTLK